MDLLLEVDRLDDVFDSRPDTRSTIRDYGFVERHDRATKKRRRSPSQECPGEQHDGQRENMDLSPEQDRQNDVLDSQADSLPLDDNSLDQPYPDGTQSSATQISPPSDLQGDSFPICRRRGRPRKEVVYSAKKKVGARCYARWSDNAYFWGTILKVTGDESQRQYSVSAAVTKERIR